jgi:hypothetical protein
MRGDDRRDDRDPREEGEGLAWVSVPMKRTEDVRLVVELRAERVIVIDANPELLVPPSVLDEPRAAACRQAASRKARVVSRGS